MSFIKEYIVEFNDMDRFGELSAVKLLDFFEETAFYHLENGYGYEKLAKDNKAWILNKWKIDMKQFPKYHNKFTVKTWCSYCKGFRAYRDFVVLDENNELLGKATSLWIFYDTNLKRPKKIPTEMINLFYCKDEEISINDFQDFKPSNNYNVYKELRIQRNDIDVNNHVNNKVFINWMEESIEEEIYSNYKLHSFEVNYLKEIKYSIDSIYSCNNVKKIEKNCHEFEHFITANKIGYALGTTSWKKYK
ncbi:MAG: acyl-ACP thioesterase domain-containing protein [Clostridiales bacterium]